MNTNELLSLLNKLILIKAGLKNIDPSHCRNISNYIFDETKSYISETTIKRFFGFAKKEHKFSLFTLNGLSQYIGYNNWESFKQENTGETVILSNRWGQLKLRAQAATNLALTIKKNNSGIPFKQTIERTFFYPDFEYFLKNNYQFTTVSSPPGHGKSILLAQLTERFFYSDNCLHKDDIILLINSSTIRSIIQSGLQIDEWLYQKLQFRNVGELFKYVRENPSHCTGRFVLIIDGIDEFLFNLDYQKIFIDLLYGIEECNFFKVVLGLRSNTWANLQPIISASAFLSRSWYEGIFFNPAYHSNIPPLSLNETLQILSNIEGIEIKEDDVNERLLKLFHIPFWITVYYKIKNEKSGFDLKNPILYYEMISQFLDQKIFLTQRSTEKIFLLKKISEIKSNGKKDLGVEKTILLQDIYQNQQAYKELIFSGILTEEKRKSGANQTEVIRFLDYGFYTYFVFKNTYDNFNHKITIDTLKYILKINKNQSPPKTYILNWIIRNCICSNEVELLKNIFILPFSNEVKNNAFDFICHNVQYELAKSDSLFKIDYNLIDILVRYKIFSLNYEKTIKIISQQELPEDLEILLLIINAKIGIITLEKNSIKTSLQALKKFKKKHRVLFPINPYDLINFFYQRLIGQNQENQALKIQVNELSESLHKPYKPHKNKLTLTEILFYRLILIYLITEKNYEGCDRFIIGILKQHPRVFLERSSIFPSFLLITLGQSCLKLNRIKKAEKIIIFLDKIIKLNYTYHTNYIKAGYYALKANFFNQSQLYGQALSSLNKGIQLAEENKFVMEFISLQLLKIDVLRKLSFDGSARESIEKLLDFLKSVQPEMPEYINLVNNDNYNTFNVIKSFNEK